MKLRLAAALALTAASVLHAQSAPVDYATATPMQGQWSYATVPGGSEATFSDAVSQPQFFLTCSRLTRQVTIARPATGAAPLLFAWTTAQARNLPASYNPATGRLGAAVSAFDPLLDAIAFSRGRFAVGIAGQAPSIFPAWPEAARVVEDCRT